LSGETREIQNPARLAAETEPLIFLLLLIFYKKAVLRDAYRNVATIFFGVFVSMGNMMVINNSKILPLTFGM
jgi:hypothetical protein